VGRRFADWRYRIILDEFLDCAIWNENSTANPYVSQFAIFNELANTAYWPTCPVCQFFN